MKNHLLKLSQIIGLLAIFLVPTLLIGQSLQDLQGNYSGNTTWNESTGTLTFSKSGTINLPNKAHNSWAVPNTVKTIIINSDVTVTGRFDVSSKITIEGKNKSTSQIFGTSIQEYAKTRGGGNADVLSAIRATAGDITIKNLTSLNPKGYAFTHRGGGFMTITDCRILDTRGGHRNNSDGIVTWGGGLVERCYFSTADDVIKVYGNITVNDCEIVMVDNTVPIQLGWGNYGNGAIGTFKNLTISGTSGRNTEGKAVISAREGTYNKTINIDGIKINNPNASLFNFAAGGNYNITITNADITVGKFRNLWTTNTNGTIKICGTSYGQNSTQTKFNCNNSTSPTNITNLVATSTGCTSVNLTWSDVSGEEAYRVRRKTATTNYVVLADVPANTTSYVDETAEENTTYQYMVRPMQGGVTVAVSNTPQILTEACYIEPVPVNTYLKAYPNPTTGVINLPEVIVNDQIQVVNQLTGKVVLTKKIIESGFTTLDITNQPAGNYIIQVVRNNQLITRQITKL